ncbi:hypothetical protein B0H19DRAFT_1292388 [Mycena capillaripes]|nr:hypothetical protein B0H19DRAFT_1292388 [Mycena capillaripes]
MVGLNLHLHKHVAKSSSERINIRDRTGSHSKRKDTCLKEKRGEVLDTNRDHQGATDQLKFKRQPNRFHASSSPFWHQLTLEPLPCLREGTFWCYQVEAVQGQSCQILPSESESQQGIVNLKLVLQLTTGDLVLEGWMEEQNESESVEIQIEPKVREESPWADSEIRYDTWLRFEFEFGVGNGYRRRQAQRRVSVVEMQQDWGRRVNVAAEILQWPPQLSGREFTYLRAAGSAAGEGAFASYGDAAGVGARAAVGEDAFAPGRGCGGGGCESNGGRGRVRIVQGLRRESGGGGGGRKQQRGRCAGRSHRAGQFSLEGGGRKNSGGRPHRVGAVRGVAQGLRIGVCVAQGRVHSCSHRAAAFTSAVRGQAQKRRRGGRKSSGGCGRKSGGIGGGGGFSHRAGGAAVKTAGTSASRRGCTRAQHSGYESSGKADAKAAAWPLRPFTLGSRGGAHSGCVGAGTKAAVAATGRVRKQRWGRCECNGVGVKSLAWRGAKTVAGPAPSRVGCAAASMKGGAVGGSAGHSPCTAVARLRLRLPRRGWVRRGRGVEDFGADLGDAGSGWSRGDLTMNPPEAVGEDPRYIRQLRGRDGAEAVVGYRRRCTKALETLRELHAHREAARTWFPPVRGSLEKWFWRGNFGDRRTTGGPSASGMPLTTSYNSLLHNENFGAALGKKIEEVDVYSPSDWLLVERWEGHQEAPLRPPGGAAAATESMPNAAGRCLCCQILSRPGAAATFAPAAASKAPLNTCASNPIHWHLMAHAPNAPPNNHRSQRRTPNRRQMMQKARTKAAAALSVQWRHVPRCWTPLPRAPSIETRWHAQPPLHALARQFSVHNVTSRSLEEALAITVSLMSNRSILLIPRRRRASPQTSGLPADVGPPLRGVPLSWPWQGLQQREAKEAVAIGLAAELLTRVLGLTLPRTQDAHMQGARERELRLGEMLGETWDRADGSGRRSQPVIPNSNGRINLPSSEFPRRAGSCDCTWHTRLEMWANMDMIGPRTLHFFWGGSMVGGMEGWRAGVAGGISNRPRMISVSLSRLDDNFKAEYSVTNRAIESQARRIRPEAHDVGEEPLDLHLPLDDIDQQNCRDSDSSKACLGDRVGGWVFSVDGWMGRVDHRTTPKLPTIRNELAGSHISERCRGFQGLTREIEERSLPTAAPPYMPQLRTNNEDMVHAATSFTTGPSFRLVRLLLRFEFVLGLPLSLLWEVGSLLVEYIANPTPRHGVSISRKSDTCKNSSTWIGKPDTFAEMGHTAQQNRHSFRESNTLARLFSLGLPHVTADPVLVDSPVSSVGLCFRSETRGNGNRGGAAKGRSGGGPQRCNGASAGDPAAQCYGRIERELRMKEVEYPAHCEYVSTSVPSVCSTCEVGWAASNSDDGPICCIIPSFGAYSVKNRSSLLTTNGSLLLVQDLLLGTPCTCCINPQTTRLSACDEMHARGREDDYGLLELGWPARLRVEDSVSGLVKFTMHQVWLLTIKSASDLGGTSILSALPAKSYTDNMSLTSQTEDNSASNLRSMMFEGAHVPAEVLDQRLQGSLQIAILLAGGVASTGDIAQDTINSGKKKNHWTFQVEILEADQTTHRSVRLAMNVQADDALSNEALAATSSRGTWSSVGSERKEAGLESSLPQSLTTLPTPLADSLDDSKLSPTSKPLNHSPGSFPNATIEAPPRRGSLVIRLQGFAGPSFRTIKTFAFPLLGRPTLGDFVRALTSRHMEDFLFKRRGSAYVGCRDWTAQALQAFVVDGLVKPEGEDGCGTLYPRLAWRYTPGATAEDDAEGAWQRREVKLFRHPVDQGIFVHYERKQLEIVYR